MIVMQHEHSDIATEQERSLAISTRPRPSQASEVSLCYCVVGKMILV